MDLKTSQNYEEAIEASWAAFFGSQQQQEALRHDVKTERARLIREKLTGENWYGSEEEQQDLRREICDQEERKNKKAA